MKSDNQKKLSVKRKRSENNYRKIQEGIKKANADKERGSTYGSGIGMTYNVPPAVEKLEEEKKKAMGVDCTLLGCYNKNHKRRSSKRCTYYGCTSDNVQSYVDAKMKRMYPSHYDE